MDEKMNLEEMKRWHINRLEKGDRHQTYLDRIDWLIAEVERQALIINGKTFYDIEKATAQDCAEIAELAFNDCNQPLESKHAHDLFMVAEDIRKKYNLEG